VVDLIAAHTHDPFKVLVSTILSARTRDETTTAASRRLFERASSPARLRELPEATIRELIYPVGFANAKARHLKQLPAVLDREFGGRIPETIEELVRLPGVGRKTANLVVAVAFGKPAICVDTHVHRITNRWGYVRTTTPLETEMRLREKLPTRYWTTINAYLVSFGQHTCKPLNPRCDICPLYDCCRRVGVRTKHRR
jgi:endonuclease III